MPTTRPALREAGPPTARVRLARSIGVTLVGNSFAPLAAFATAPILAHALGVDGRGALAAATAPFLLATTAATLGIPEALTYTIARSPSVVRRASRNGMLVLLTTGLLAVAAVLLAAPLLSAGDRGLAALMVLATVGLVPALCLGAARGVAAGLHRWDLVARERAVASLLRLAAIAGLAAAGHLTPLTATLTIALSPVLAGAAYLPLRRVVWDGDARDGPGPGAAAPARAAGLLHYGSRVWVGSLSGVLLARMDQLLMAPLAGTFELGLYAVAVNVGEVPLVVNSAVRDVVFSADAGDRSDGRLTTAARLSSVAVAVSALVLAATLPLWVEVVFGAEFAPAVPVAWVLLAAVALGMPGSVAGAALSARGRPGLRSASLLVASVVNVALVLVLVPAHGALGAAAATLAGSVLAGTLNVVLVRRHFGIPPLAFYGLRRADLAVLASAARRVRAARRTAG